MTSMDRKSNLDSSQTCTTVKAEDFDVEAESRGDDPDALAEPRRAINDATGGAEQAQEAELTDTTDVKRAVTTISRETQISGAT